MIDTSRFKNLNDKTAILESLDWDETAFEQLVSFIDLQKECFVPTHPIDLLNQIEEFFGITKRKVLENIFKEEYEKIKGDKNEN